MFCVFAFFWPRGCSQRSSVMESLCGQPLCFSPQLLWPSPHLQYILAVPPPCLGTLAGHVTIATCALTKLLAKVSEPVITVSGYVTYICLEFMETRFVSVSWVEFCPLFFSCSHQKSTFNNWHSCCVVGLPVAKVAGAYKSMNKKTRGAFQEMFFATFVPVHCSRKKQLCEWNSLSFFFQVLMHRDLSLSKENKKNSTCQNLCFRYSLFAQDQSPLFVIKRRQKPNEKTKLLPLFCCQIWHEDNETSQDF